MNAIFLNREKAAELLGISERTFERKYVYTGLVPAVRFPSAQDEEHTRRNVYLRRDVDKILASRPR